MLQVQRRPIDGALVAAALVAQAEGVRGAAPDVVLAAVDRLVLVILVVEVLAQMPAQQLQQAPGARELLGAAPRVAMQLLLLLVLAQIHGGAGRRAAAGARLGAVVWRKGIHGNGFYSSFISCDFASVFSPFFGSLCVTWHLIWFFQNQFEFF